MPLDPPATGLPVEECLPALREALADVGAAVLQAEPGAGKSTVVPLRLLHEPWLGDQRIVMLEPRRLATRATAERMAHLLGEDVGATVGYRTRDDRRVSRATRVEVVTEGILTRRLQRDPSLPGTGLVIFDEIHERNLQSDLALALTLDVRGGLRPALAVLAMSATLDRARLATAIGGDAGSAPVVTSAGRSHPVEIRWRPRPPGGRLVAAMVTTVADALRSDPGDVLAFLPGAREIRQVATALAADGVVPDDVDVRPLFGALSREEQDAALAPSPTGRRRVVLATDIAETSLTVDGVRIVIDGGEVRRPRYDDRSGLTRLDTGRTSKASADQRAGRAGRTAPGIAYRLWSEAEHAPRAPFAPPEIDSVDLAGLTLELAVWGAGADDLAFLDRPPQRRLDEATTLLRRLGAVDASGRPTRAGRAMVELPLHPRLAHMVLSSRDSGTGWLACALAALLEDRDLLRGRPEELPADVGERVRLITERDRRHPQLDRAAANTTRRHARALARRVQVEPGFVDLTASGPVLALAYPDRIAQSRGGGRFRLRSGRGVAVAAHDPLAAEPYLVVAELGPGRPGRDDDGIRLAAPLDLVDVEAAAAADITTVTALEWDDLRDELIERTERRLDALVLASSVDAPKPSAEAAAALVDHVRVERLEPLSWSDRARALQSRIGFARRSQGEPWPDVTEAALLVEIDEWLAPLLVGATRRRDLERVDMVSVLRGQLDHHQLGALDRVAPVACGVPSGRKVPIDYDTEPPTLSARAQELFGLVTHPTVGGGGVALAVRVLSPAGQVVQVTSDIPGFWAGSWAEVRKEMASRYPKHNWPADPAHAEPSTRAERRR